MYWEAAVFNLRKGGPKGWQPLQRPTGLDGHRGSCTAGNQRLRPQGREAEAEPVLFAGLEAGLGGGC